MSIKPDADSSLEVVPHRVNIVAMGDSRNGYLQARCSSDGHAATWGEVWGINLINCAMRVDRAFVMDPIGEYLDRYTGHITKPLLSIDVPIYTTEHDPRFPTSVPYPLKEVVESTGVPCLTTTGAYAIAYALHIGVKELMLWGLDYTYPDKQIAEEGKANVEWLLCLAQQRGVAIGIAKGCTLLWAHKPREQRFYGYRGSAPL